MSGRYANIPLPPRLASLPLDHRGVPVPYITPWKAQFADGRSPFELRQTAKSGVIVACRCRPGVGRPVLGTQCPTRQRRAMTHRLCGVCGQPHEPGADLAFVGKPGDLFPEAPQHPECLAYSVKACPALRDDDRTGAVFTAKDYRLFEQRVEIKPDGSIGRKQTFPEGDKAASTAGALWIHLAEPLNPNGPLELGHWIRLHSFTSLLGSGD